MKFSLKIRRNAKITSVDAAGNRLDVKKAKTTVYVNSDAIKNISKCTCCSNTNIFFSDETDNLYVVDPHDVEILATEVAAQHKLDASVRSLESGGGK